jgi:hypothetical protein
MTEIDSEQFKEGLTAYERGATVRGLIEATERLEKEQPDNTNAPPSLIAGFLEGLLADIRRLRVPKS